MEAISLDFPSEENKAWIGINQNAAKRYVEHFLRNGGFGDMIDSQGDVKREQFLGISKLDFLVGNTYLEVETPLTELQVPIRPHIKTKKVAEFQSFERFLKHINELSSSLKESERAILLTCFLYDNVGYTVSTKGKYSRLIRGAVQDTIGQGIEIWQANFKITPQKVELLRFFETTVNFLEGGAALRED